MSLMLIIGIIIAVFIILTAILPLKIHNGWKIALGILTTASALKFHLNHLLGGPMFFAPNLPRSILILTAIAFTTVFLYFILLAAGLILDGIFALVLWSIQKKRPEFSRWRTLYNYMNLFWLLAAFLLTTFCLREGMKLPEIRQVTLEFSDLPPAAEDMTIVLLSDLHVDKATPEKQMRKIVYLCNMLHPDLTVITGDFVDGNIRTSRQLLLPLEDLTARYGVYGVPGNHEYYSGFRDWIPFFEKLGVRMLLNQAVQLPNGVWLAGVTDPQAWRFHEVLPDPACAAAGIPPGAFAVLLGHQPKLARNASRFFSLQLAGHTHGGMIWGFDRIVAHFNHGYVSGLYEVNGMKLYVSNGTGIWQGFPVRIGRPAEITLIRLKKKK